MYICSFAGASKNIEMKFGSCEIAVWYGEAGALYASVIPA
jgi:hypothetical protein